jgi:cation diffusion facilitator CzcD-associated flavoprotein CzcO
MGIALDHEVVIVGSGYGGICTAIQLQRAGIDDFVILEKDAQFGGTWRVNNYPGAACDIPSHLYSFSFAQNGNWSRLFPRQSELLDYMCGIVRDFGLQRHLRLGTNMRAAHYDAEGGYWRIETSQGHCTARVLVSAIGALSRPSLPAIPGLDSFAGTSFHSANWRHDVDLRGKRVAVIGSGASAVQFVPEIAGQVAQLDLYQRSAHWVMPRPDRAITRLEQWLLNRVKPLQSLYRALHYMTYESRAIVFNHLRWLVVVPQWQARRHLRRQIADPVLRAKLMPRYTLGCKRVLLTSDYYPALTRSNVSLQTEGIRAVLPHAIVTASGEERPVDVIIYATGFDVEHTLGSADVRGRDGIALREVLAAGGGAYKGAALAGFPNYFMITGPNTALGHNSMIYMIESGVRYVVDAIVALRRHGLHSVEVRQEVLQAFNAGLQRRLQKTVWNSGCKSWYLDSHGRNLTLWPGFTFSYRRITRKFDIHNYTIQETTSCNKNSIT